jgi:hypothetical protein
MVARSSCGARAADRGLEVRRGDVELAILAEEDMTSNASTSASHSQAVSLAKVIHGSEGVLVHLDHLGRPDRCSDELARQVPEELSQLVSRRLGIRAHDREGRLVVIANGRTLAQEFRLEADVEIGAVLLAGLGLEDGTQHALERARNERRAEYEHVRRVLPA